MSRRVEVVYGDNQRGIAVVSDEEADRFRDEVTSADPLLVWVTVGGLTMRRGSVISIDIREHR